MPGANRQRSLAILLVLGAALPGGVVAQAPEDSRAAQDPTDPSQSDGTAAVPLEAGVSMEEVVVYGQRSLNALRYQVYRAEEVFYDTYNSMNSDDEFDISCKQSTPIGSHVARRVCTARFVRDLNSDFARSLLRGDPVGAINAQMIAKGLELRQDMREVTQEQPAVLEALIQYVQIKQHFESERKRRCEGRILFCRR